MAVSKAQREADKKYKAGKTKQVVIRFYPKDMDLYEHLRRQGNKMGYIKGLIADDMRGSAPAGDGSGSQRTRMERAPANGLSDYVEAGKAIIAKGPEPAARHEVTRIDGGYRVVSPSGRVYEAPDSLDALKGPSEGVIRLPLRIDWTPLHDIGYEASEDGSCIKAYTLVLAEGSLSDILAFVNGDRLAALWPSIRHTVNPELAKLWDSAIGAERDNGRSK